MNGLRSRRVGLAAGLLLAAATLGSPPGSAQSGVRGGHMSAPVAVHGMGHPAAGRYAPPAAYGGRGAYGAPRAYYAGHPAPSRYGTAAAGRYAPGYASGMGAGYHYYGRAGAPYASGYWYGGHGWSGGYWNGCYWPHVWYYPGWSWYLPVLPLGYATFWWSGSPYYYWNNLYYTWNPGYNGYVVTDPPPAAGASDAAAYAAGQYAEAAPAGAASAGDVYVYPRSGQTDAQLQTDRYECHAWAVGQTGFDPTRSGTQTGTAADYRRAMIACLDARGYSAR